MQGSTQLFSILYFAELAASGNPTIKMGHPTSISIIKMIILKFAQKTLSLVIPDTVKMRIRSNHYTPNMPLAFAIKVIEAV